MRYIETNLSPIPGMVGPRHDPRVVSIKIREDEVALGDGTWIITKEVHELRCDCGCTQKLTELVFEKERRRRETPDPFGRAAAIAKELAEHDAENRRLHRAAEETFADLERLKRRDAEEAWRRGIR